MHGHKQRLSDIISNNPHYSKVEVARTGVATSSDSGSFTHKGSDSSINGMNGMHTLISGDDSFDPLHAFSTKSLRIASKGEKGKKSTVSKHDQSALIAKSVSQQGNRPLPTGRTGAGS